MDCGPDHLVRADHGHCVERVWLARGDGLEFSVCIVAAARDVRRLSFRRRARDVVCARRLLVAAVGFTTRRCVAGVCRGCVARDRVLVSGESVVLVCGLGGGVAGVYARRVANSLVDERGCDARNGARDCANRRA